MGVWLGKKWRGDSLCNLILSFAITSIDKLLNGSVVETRLPLSSPPFSPHPTPPPPPSRHYFSHKPSLSPIPSASSPPTPARPPPPHHPSTYSVHPLSSSRPFFLLFLIFFFPLLVLRLLRKIRQAVSNSPFDPRPKPPLPSTTSLPVLSPPLLPPLTPPPPSPYRHHPSSASVPCLVSIFFVCATHVPFIAWWLLPRPRYRSRPFR